MIDWSKCCEVEADPDKVSGAWVFVGTRIPIAALFENLEEGASVQDFVAWFPGVSLEQAKAVLEHAARSSNEHPGRHHREQANDGFGLWGERDVDGLDYQERIRREF